MEHHGPEAMEAPLNSDATAHATTGAAQFWLLRRRPMRTKLNVLPFSKDTGQYEQIRARVIHHQDRSKRYTDAKKGAKPFRLVVCDRVQICKPFMFHSWVHWSLVSAATDWIEQLVFHSVQRRMLSRCRLVKGRKVTTQKKLQKDILFLTDIESLDQGLCSKIIYKKWKKNVRVEKKHTWAVGQ